jgi:hypothetical protein
LVDFAASRIVPTEDQAKSQKKYLRAVQAASVLQRVREGWFAAGFAP